MTELSPTERAKRKQIVLLIAIAVGIFALAGVGVWLTDESPTAIGVTKKTDITTKSYIAPGEKIDPQDAWRGVSDTRLNTVESQLTALSTENRELKRRLGEKPNQTGKGGSPESLNDSELDKRLAEYEKSVEQPNPGYPPGQPSNPQSELQVPPAQPFPATAKRPAARALGVAEQVPPAQSGGIITVRLSRQAADDLGKTLPRESTQAGRSAGREPTKTTQNYLPAGMFGQAILLSGLDAPTGGQAQSNPHPVLFQLTDLAKLPNRYKYDWDQCLITGAGYGDLSSERGYIRTETLACVSKDGKVLDVPIKGYIVGEDGKAGMRGRMVTKQGQVLSNGLLAGVVAGIGTGLERSSSIQSISPLGSTNTIKPGDEFQSGIGHGTGRALDRLANYYIQLAEKMFPVIEIDAARVVDVVLTQGVLIDVEPTDE